MFWLIMLVLWVLSFPLSEWAKKRQARARASTTAVVSRNKQTGPKWEQDKPYNLDETGDDL